jgi:predicted nucleotidyltransferase
MALGPIDIPTDRIADFCRRWKVTEFALFGSVLREDFRPDSDVDVLVSFQPTAGKSMDAWLDMIEELKAIFGREVDLVERQCLRNPFRRHRILTTAKVIYAA